MRHARNHLESWMKGSGRLISQCVFSERLRLHLASLWDLFIHLCDTCVIPLCDRLTPWVLCDTWHLCLTAQSQESLLSVCWPQPGQCRGSDISSLLHFCPGRDPQLPPLMSLMSLMSVVSRSSALNPPSQNSPRFLFPANPGQSYLWCIANTFIRCRKKTATNFLVVTKFYLVWGIPL